MDLINKTVITLPLTSCIFLELPNENYDCASEPDEFNRTVCIRCPVTQRFFSGESLNDFHSPGHIITFILGILTFFVGTFGSVANLLIILILRRQKSGRAFDTMLTGLAVFDFMWSAASLISATSAVFYIRNWDRGRMTLECFTKSHYFALFGRTGSSFMTILIAFERYMVVSRPVKAAIYITPARVRMAVICTAIFAVLMGIPRFTSTYVSVNIIRHNVSTAQDMDYLVMDTQLGKFWHETLSGIVSQIDYWLPLPLLLLLNGLIYREIQKIAKRRKEITTSQRKELSATEMFCPVVAVLAACYILPLMHYYFIFTKSVVYWELTMGMLLSFSANAAVNLPIYYWKGTCFKMETKALLCAYKTRLCSLCCGRHQSVRSNSEKSSDASVKSRSLTTRTSRLSV